jgi:MoaD family protein
MKINVAYHGQLRAAAGAANEELETHSGASVQDFLARLARSRPALKPFLLGPDDGPSRSLLLLVNDRQVRPGERRALKDGDSVALLPPIGGG